MKTDRVFLVGCPRSGTTLLQSMVASHPQVISFPETHFFSQTLPINPFLRRLKWYGAGSRKYITSFLEKNDYTDFNPFSDTPTLCSHNQWCKYLLRTIDSMTLHKSQHLSSSKIWGLEKTPRHLFYISSIQQNGFNNKFLHILRNGPDVVASLYLATQNYPDQWGGARSVKKCINWWNSSIKESLKYKDDSNHLFITYEQIIDAPEVVLQTVCSFLELDYQESMLNDFHNTAGSLTQEEEKWKQKNTRQSLHQSNKLQKHFDSSTIEQIKKNVLDIDVTNYYH